MSKKYEVQKTGGQDMKLVMCQTWCSAKGNAFKNTVMDIAAGDTQEIEVDGKPARVPLAEFMLQNKFARPYNSETDAKLKQHGLVRAER